MSRLAWLLRARYSRNLRKAAGTKNKFLRGTLIAMGSLAGIAVIAAAFLIVPRAWGDRQLRRLLEEAPVLPFSPRPLPARPPNEGWALGMVSWLAVDDAGLIYVLQRGDSADPVVVFDRDGRVRRSWGRGMFTMPHSIRIAPNGNVWTTDAKTSRVLEFTPEGKLLAEIAVGSVPDGCKSDFCGTTDVAFGPGGSVFIADGYRNARILEYSPERRLVREWGSYGSGRGQFRLPHSLVVDDQEVLWVADRENGRIQRFDLHGNWLGEWTAYGKTFSLAVSPGAIWLGTQQRTDPNFSPGWILKVDRATGALHGSVEVTGIHGIHVESSGDVLVSPGPGTGPLRLRAVPQANQALLGEDRQE